MFRKIKAIRLGQKLGQSIAIVTADTINYLISCGCKVGIRDTGYFLLETNSL
jgi:hypothetical protein